MGGLASVALAASTAAASSWQPDPVDLTGDVAGDVAAKIQPELASQFTGDTAEGFWVRFADSADLSRASGIRDWDRRGAEVARQLRETALASQAGVRASLDREGVEYQAFWATNAIRVEGGSPELAMALAGDAEVAELLPTFRVDLPDPVPGGDVARVQSVEWGIANINADDVWREGVRGEGVVIANIDSGVQYDHPALVGSYRGNNGDGTFTHDYNWFDHAGTRDHPVDNDGHGTHTMGTMVGDDGAGNQIGVAPGATWIAANGCCPTDAALIASGQWMLEPTDLDGNNPDASKRPNIINNSWGSESPSNAAFMEDISNAWAASGIFGVWSNGNNGSRCRTSGSPGSRIANYSVGAYDATNTVAGFSSRGAGQDGETKPNISAPGVDVRSSIPGNGYASYNGTSMAAPHVAGTVALLWAASPALAGEIDATRDLLDGTAVDQPDTQCGGTAGANGDDNNVYGEGRLDALALVEAAPSGAAGVLAGTVTDAVTGRPVPGATVTITGEVERERTSGADGTFEARLPAGEFTVAVSAYLYQDTTEAVTVEAGRTTLGVALESVPTATITGTVLDGSGQGWPLYAKVTVDGEAALSDHTDPATGRYAIRVPVDTTWTLSVASQYEGYLAPDPIRIEVGSADVVNDVALPVDASRCVAAGYRLGPIQPVLTENFDAGALPAGWTIDDRVGKGQNWVFDDPKQRGNRSGGTGAFAIIDSESFFLDTQDTALVTPPLDLSAAESVAVTFRQHYDSYYKDTYADVDVSVDGGETWSSVRSQTGVSVRGPNLTELAVPRAAGNGEVVFRWHYGSYFGHHWQIDDVVIGTRSCDPVDGGLVVGQVSDRNTGAALAGATVTDLAAPDRAVTTTATPDDRDLGDGFWWTVAEPAGEHRFSATSAEYQDGAATVAVRPRWATEVDFALAAGIVTVDRTEVRSSLKLGGAATRTFTVTNEGTAPAEVELAGRDGAFEILGGGGGGATTVRQLDSAATAATTAATLAARAAPATARAGFGGSGLPAGRTATTVAPHAAEDELTITHSVSQDLMVNSTSCAGGDTTSAVGFLRVFDLADFDIETDFTVTSVSFGVESARGAQQLGVRLHTLDGELTYDNLTLIGSAETTLEPQEMTMVSVPVSGTAPKGSTLVVELDSPDLTNLGGAFFPGSNDLGQTGPTYLRAVDCATPEPTSTDQLGFPEMHLVLNVTGKVDNDLRWLGVAPEAVTIAPGDSVEVTVTMDSAQIDQPGTYTGRIRLSEDTPYAGPSVGATMTVSPPAKWGKVLGAVTGTSCAGATAPLADATVQIDWWSGYRTLYTDAAGGYAYWLDTRGNPYTVVVAKDGYRPLVKTLRITKGKAVTLDVALHEANC
ncbi:hypothetical protein BLA60_22285 [Actinophytocola xinjiangensis]|uniref:Peptidase S8/S53 domain-containing protein n=1 Tax=Actinophytocola xinjiangensis TaxID=485602 RepID=A0A7Z1AX60_9PSEU|nr:hypothetical protein BLA60_22285 [Actinophytocola xinjiangensis]